MKKIIASVLIIVFAFSVLLTGCTKSSQNTSAKSAAKALDAAIGTKGIASTNVGGVWYVSTPYGDSFEFSPCTSSSPETFIAISFILKPFTDAGLRPEKLNSSMYFCDPEKNILTIKKIYGDKLYEYDKTSDFGPLMGMMENYPASLIVNDKLGMYAMDVGDGNRFAWSMDALAQGSNVTFFLSPKPLTDAGLVIERLEGFTLVEYETSAGQKAVKLSKSVVLSPK